MRFAGFIPIVVSLLTSCVGGGLMLGKKEEHSKFGINSTRSIPMRRVTEAQGGANPSREQVRERWGEPDGRQLEDGEELWTYRKGMAVRGAVPMLGVGIPLVCPVGKNHFGFHFRSGKDEAEKLVVESNQMKGGYFGVSAFSDSKGIGFHNFED